MTNANSRISLGTKLTYVVIVLMWIAAAAAVYYTFFASNSSRARQAADETKGESISEGKPSEDETIVLNTQGQVVQTEEDLLPRKLENYEFVDQSNEAVSVESLKGKPWVATFVFTKCPGPCPMITGRMRVLQKDLKRYDFNLISVSVDPERDSPEILTKYSQAFSADLANWKFLTGDRAAIYSLIQEGFKMPVGEIKPGDILHTNRFVVVDSEGNYVDSFLGMNDEEFAKLKKRVRELANLKTETDSSESEDEPDEKSQDGE